MLFPFERSSGRDRVTMVEVGAAITSDIEAIRRELGWTWTWKRLRLLRSFHGQTDGGGGSSAGEKSLARWLGRTDGRTHRRRGGKEPQSQDRGHCTAPAAAARRARRAVRPLARSVLHRGPDSPGRPTRRRRGYVISPLGPHAQATLARFGFLPFVSHYEISFPFSFWQITSPCRG